MNKTIIITIMIAAVAAFIGYLYLPEDKEAQLIEEAMKIKVKTDHFVDAICSDSNDMPREYLIELIQNEYPDKKIEDLCPETVPQN